MTKIKVIKRGDDEKLPAASPKTVSNERQKKERSMEGTVKDWITERRENDDAEDRNRRSQLDSWNPELAPDEAPV